jgi:putative transposase
MRYRFIQAEKAQDPVEVLCRVMAVARSGFSAWGHRPMTRRAQHNQHLLAQIQLCHRESKAAMGAPGFTETCVRRACGSVGTGWPG